MNLCELSCRSDKHVSEGQICVRMKINITVNLIMTEHWTCFSSYFTRFHTNAYAFNFLPFPHFAFVLLFLVGKLQSLFALCDSPCESFVFVCSVHSSPCACWSLEICCTSKLIAYLRCIYFDIFLFYVILDYNFEYIPNCRKGKHLQFTGQPIGYTVTQLFLLFSL